jgi:hypothetical protein
MIGLTIGRWMEIKPTRLRRNRKHSWIFAHYYETPSEREDNAWYEAFLFRNEDRTVFGIKERVGGDPGLFANCQAMAARVIKDKRFRDSLVSSDPDLPRMWKRH